ncbi:MAG: hypothetical protein JNK82_30725, partial [Myxococcaceae bacterium]|nr:hypothetical protein [Myxococcaceae bacterium]
MLPESRGPFNPGQLELAGDGQMHGAELRDVMTCGGCHPDAVAQWRTSAHAFASFNNPVYRLSVDRLRMEVGTKASRMCASCHDIALLTEGAMDVPEVKPEDPRGHAAITCQTCHGVVSTRPDGNGSYAVDTRDFPIPTHDDPEGSLAKHRARVATKGLRTAELCGSCHRSFLDESTGNASAFFGMDDYTPWSRSEFGKSSASRIDAEVAKAECRDCHMAREPAADDVSGKRDGKIASHRFLGGHSWLAAMQGDAAQIERYRRFLRGVASVDVAPGVRLDGKRLQFDVVIRNLTVGHRFPSGVMDAQDTRLEVKVTDARGRVLALDDSHALRSEVLDKTGTPLKLRETHRFVTPVWNRTVEPRGVQAARYLLDVPADAVQPVNIGVRLLHKSRNETLRRSACAESQTALGQAFGAASKRLNGVALDPCVEQPIIEVASARHTVGRKDVSPSPLWERLYFYGLALTGALQEYADEARVPLQAALEAAPDDRSRARVLAGLCALDGRQGRTAEALAWCAQAEKLAPGHPAIDRLKGLALANVWRWAEASVELEKCAKKVPDDLEAWRLLAVSLGSAGRDADALAAAQKGLALQPREADLLRVQALSMAALGMDSGLALEKALQYRVPDNYSSV